ncbi:MAG: sensor histidine kinase, partial [Chthoniobacterales bacterium]
PGLAMATLSVSADLISDARARVPIPGFLGIASSCVYFFVFIFLLSRCHSLFENMQRRVEERTAELQREIVARKGLERKVAEAGDHERRRLGRELHDSLCQHLTGTALQAEMLVTALQARNDPTLATARKVVSLVNAGTHIARDIARGLFSLELEGDGLTYALDVLAKTTSAQYGIVCSFDHNVEARMSLERGSQLYWIAREAVTNAVTHAKPTCIAIRLSGSGGNVELSVEDDGLGILIPEVRSNGIGLQVMAQRAELAGGHLAVERSGYGGAAIRCNLSLNA